MPANAAASPTPTLLITPQFVPVTPLAPDSLIVPADIPWSDLASNSGLTFTSFTIVDGNDATPSYCTDECFTTLWRTQDMSFTVTLAIARASSPDHVPEIIRGYYLTLYELAPEYRTGPEFHLVHAPFANTTFADSQHRAVEWLTTSVDNVAILVGVWYRPPPSTVYDFDDNGTILMLAELANRQIAKLQAVGAVR